VKHPASYISDHLLVCLTLAFISGIAIAPRLSLSATTTSGLGLGLLLFLIPPALLHLLGRRKTVLCLLLPFFAALGCYHALVALQPPKGANHVFHRSNGKTEAVVVGTLVALAEFDGTTSQVILSAEHLRFADTPDLLPTVGKILLRLPGPWPVELTPGDRLVVRADLKRPDSSRTPGVFDYAQYLAQKDIWMNGFVRSPLFLEKLPEKQSLLHTLRYLPEKIRARIGNHIDTAVPTELSGVYRAILIGDYSRVDDATLESFKGSGTMHILSISGLHMTVIGTLLYALFYWLFCRSEKLLLHYPLRKWAGLLCIPVLLGYGLLAGMNTPVFRAVIMSCMIIIAICTDRRKSPSALLAWAAMIILVADPLQLLNASFQLSFVATMAILFLFPVLKKLVLADATVPTSTVKRIVVNWLVAGLLVSAVATLATTPITLYAFNRFSPVGLLANLIVEPLICLWSLPAGFLSIPFLFLQPEISTWFLRIGAVGLGGAIHCATFFSSLPLSTLWLPPPPIWLMAVYYAGLLGCTQWGRLTRMWSWFSVAVLTVGLLLMLHPPAFLRRSTADFLQLSFIDVGQGNATLLEFPSGLTVLIDGGGSSSASSSVGERVIAPYLWYKGIRKLDAVVITHPDADHYNGLGFILEHFSPTTLWVRDRSGHDDNFRQLLRLAEQGQVAVVVPRDGERLVSEKKSDSLQCITNISGDFATSDVPDSRNLANTGIVVKACSQQRCALFPGDIGRAVEYSLIRSGYDLTADILLAPHHGSITSNSPEFLAAVSPAVMVVSAGRTGRGHFPHDRLQDDCDRQGITLLTTSRQGTLETLVGPKLLQVFGYARREDNPLQPFQRTMVSKTRSE
jgi:competence protein ComEC